MRKIPGFIIVSVLVSLLLTINVYLYGPSVPLIGSRTRTSIPIIAIDGSFDWSTLTQRHPVPSIIPLPADKPHALPRIQFEFAKESRRDASVRQSRQQEVLEAFRRCWYSYKDKAWLKDELEPLTGTGKNTFGGWGATLIDALDTLWIMNLEDDFREAVRAVAVLDWSNTTDTSCNMFETNIRYLGGLLAAYDLSHQPALLAKAIELGDMLYTGFDTPNRMPPFWLDFELAKTGNLATDTKNQAASVGSFSLEFTRLSQLTGDSKYYDAIVRVNAMFERNQNSTLLPGMWPTFIDAKNEIFNDNSFTLGAMADSLFEYLPKMYLMLGGVEPIYQRMYEYAMTTVQDHLLFRPMTPANNDILFSGTARVKNHNITLAPEGQHLSCYAGGMFALGGKLFGLQDHFNIGDRVTKGCIYAYSVFSTGIMPESFSMLTCDSLKGCAWDEEQWMRYSNTSLPKGFCSVREPYYSLRPEAIESVFLLYRMTGDKSLQDAAWGMFQSIQNATKTEYGNAAIYDVNASGKSRHKNSMESFWLAETLKYFYLIFSPPDLISLDDYVFNTEAHPLKRPKR